MSVLFAAGLLPVATKHSYHSSQSSKLQVCPQPALGSALSTVYLKTEPAPTKPIQVTVTFYEFAVHSDCASQLEQSKVRNIRKLWLEPDLAELKLYEGRKLSPFQVTLDDESAPFKLMLDVKQTTHSS